MEPRYNPEIRPASWVPLNKVALQQWVSKTFEYPTQTELFKQQRFVRDFVQPDSPYRGLLLYHGLGVGKTAASIAAAEPFLATNRKIIVMLPAFLRDNFIGEIQMYGNKRFSTEQYWSFVEKHDVDEDLLKQLGVKKPKYFFHRKTAKLQGVWLNDEPSKEPNFSGLKSINQSQIRKQLRDMVESKYTFVYYNGVNTKAMLEMTQDNTVNPFDDAFIIIDEVHNFISRVVNGGKTGPTLYKLIMTAKNCKLILLSGTPLINYPHEAAYILNMVRGRECSYKIKIAKKSYDVETARKYLTTHALIESHSFIDDYLNVSLTPEGFFKANDGKLKKDTEIRSSKSILQSIARDLVKQCKISFAAKDASWTMKEIDLIPVDEDTFNSLFIDFENIRLMNPSMLSRRVQGLVSYYNAYPKELYPEVEPLNIVELPMSQYQFNKYAVQRHKELENEKRARKNKLRYNRHSNGDDSNVFKNNGNIYRCFSRAVCNFVFPNDIVRPYPSTLKQFRDGEMDDADLIIDEEDDETSEDVSSYQYQLDKALAKLKSKGDTYLSMDSLDTFSPKFKAVIQSVTNCPGTSLVYSQFRKVEGLGVMSLAFDMNGFEELRLERGDDGEFSLSPITPNKMRYASFKSDDKEALQIILNIFNNKFDKLPKNIQHQLNDLCDSFGNLYGHALKVLMITQSGSEGISLKNVREVHILEPYWNQIRVHQVIGRAVRANSHIALPVEERNVKAYMYLCTFDKQQCNGTSLELEDGCETSDEYIHGVATKKAIIMSQILDVMKKSSIDCRLHTRDHDNVKCYEFPQTFASDDMAYNSNIKLDTPDVVFRHAQVVKKQHQMQLKIIKMPDGKRFAADAATGVLYDVEKAKENNLIAVGKLKRIDGKTSYELIKPS